MTAGPRAVAEPCTPLAQSMVLASLRHPRSGVYVLQDVCTCSGALNTALLRKAWKQLATRHAALRTCIVSDSGGEVRQRVEAAPDFPWRELDWTKTAADQPERELAALLEEDRRAGFDFRGDVPLRIALIRTHAAWIVVLTAHHALLDGRSLLVIWKQWFEIYEASAEGRTPNFEEPVESVRDKVPEAPLFWQSYLAGLSSMAGTITDRLRPAVPAPLEPYGNHRGSLDVAITGKLRDLAAAQKVSLATLVHAAWSILLSRYTGRSDVVFGVTRSGRGAGHENLVGLLIRTLPVRIRVDERATLLPWLQQIHRDAQAMREVEAANLEEALSWGGFPAGAPPFDSMVVYDHEPPQEALQRLGGNWVQRGHLRFQTTAFPLALGVYGGPALSLNIGFDTTLYCEATAAAMAGHMLAILTNFTAMGEGCLANIGMLTHPEEVLLCTQNTIAFQDVCAHQLFETQVLRTPAAPALEEGGQIVTYAHLNRRANQLAHRLRAQGVGPEDVVAVCQPRIGDSIVSMFGILKAGGAFLPLDPAWPSERRAEVLREARPKVTIEGDLDLDDLPDIAPASSASPDNAAYVIFTSGSTGRSKGIVLPHRALVNHTLAAAPVYDITVGDRRLQFASPGADVFVAEVFNYLTRGATLVCYPDARRSSLQDFHRFLEKLQITIVSVPGSWWNVWVRALYSGTLSLPASLRIVISGMERADPVALHQWRRATQSRVRWFNVYGPAENGPTSTIYEAGTSTWECAALLPVGRPIANTTAYVLDEYGRLAPPGLAGEIHLGGAGLSRGYLGAPELNQERFVDDPFRPGERIYRTGDRGFALPDGNLVFLGRRDRQIKVRGYRVELDEIEHALDRCPGVKQCAVVAPEDEGKPRLIAYIVGEASEAQLRLHLARLLPDCMIPALWIILDHLPLTPGGKIDRLALPPPSSGSGIQRNQSPSVTDSECRLIKLWQDVLKTSEVSVHDDFFALGGDSLSATVMLLRVQEEFGIELPMSVMFQSPTPAWLAARIDRVGAPEGLLAIRTGSLRPPFICVSTTVAGPRCLGRLARSLKADQPFYVVPHFAPERPEENLIPDLADKVAASLRKDLPRAEYTIGGYCFAGAVAFETAQRLVDAGGSVRMVVLFDSPAPGYPKFGASGMNYLRHLRRMISRRSFYGNTASVADIPSHVAKVADVLRRRVQLRYEPRPARFPVVQFLADREEIHARVLADPRLGWRDLCSKFLLYRIPATHGSMFDAGNIARIAEVLEPLLENPRRA